MLRVPLAIICITLSSAGISTAQVSEGDSLALANLYNVTTGAGWTDSSNWLAGPVSAWFGITVTGNRVTEIELPSNNLVGALPASIADLDSLTALHLSGNELTGSIPAELGSLKQLEALSVNDNQLSGEIPPEIADMTSLRRVFIRRNLLTGEIPPGIGSLERLVLFDASKNLLEGPIPAELGDAKQLVNLSLSGNQFTGPIPGELGTLSSLQALDLDRNQLTGPIPDELTALVKLGLFDVGDNLLEGPIPLGFTAMTSMNVFRFNNTSLCEPADQAFQDWLAGISTVESTGVQCTTTATEASDDLPSEYRLGDNFPNPFNPTTLISYDLPERSHVSLTVFDAVGRHVAELVQADKAAGRYSVSFDAGGLPSGAYFYRLESGQFVDTGGMLLLK